MDVGTGLDTQSPERASGYTYMRALEPAWTPTGPKGPVGNVWDTYLHMGTGPYALRPEGVGGEPYSARGN